VDIANTAMQVSLTSSGRYQYQHKQTKEQKDS
jgi:hypothetical protein